MSNKTPTSGALSLSAVKAALEIYDSGPISMSDPRFRAFAHHKSGSFSMSSFYGKEEFGAHIKAANDDNGQATGYYLSFWGENDTPEFGAYTFVAAYDSVADNGFLFTANGDQTQNIFNAIIINNNIFYEEDATTFQYDVGSDTTTWKWSGQNAGLVAGTIYQMNFLISDATAAAATLPLGQGTDWTLVFEDNFDDATLNLSKWQTAQWYLHGSASADPAGVTNYDLSGGYLRIWPVNNSGTWVQRDLTTDGIFSQVTGYWEIKCRIPVNPGIRCTFWLMNHQTTARPIIGIMEALPKQSADSGWADASGNAIDYGFSVQPSTDGVTLLSKRYRDLGFAAINLSNADHVFGIKKDETSISFYFDGALVYTQAVTGPNAMTLAQFLNVTVDYNVGSGLTGPSTLNTIQNSSGAFKVDYVRAWSPGAQAGSGDNGGSTGSTGYVAPLGQNSSNFPYLTFRDEFDGSSVDTTKWGTSEYNTIEVSYNVFNKGVSGQGTGRLLAGGYGSAPALSVSLAASSAKYCIFNHGLNDADPAQENNSVSTYQANLLTMYTDVVNAGKTMILETPNPCNNFDVSPYVTAMRNFATAHNIGLIDNYQFVQDYLAANSLTITDVCPDGEHPNQTLYDLKGANAASRFMEITSGIGGNVDYYGDSTIVGLLQGGGTANPTPVQTFASASGYAAKTNTLVSGSAMQMWPQAPYVNALVDYQATLTSDGKFMQKYGYFEIRMKLPIGKATEPAFSLQNHELTGSNPRFYVGYANPGDVANGFGSAAYHPLQYLFELINSSNTVLFSDRSGAHVGSIDLSADWHTYGLDWGPGYFQFYFDGSKIGNQVTYSGTTSDLRMYFLLRLWLLTTYGQADTTNTIDGAANTMYIDYVRAWGRADGSTVTGGTMPALPYEQGGKNTGSTTPTTAPIVEFYGDSTVWGYKSGSGGQVATPMPLSFAQQRTEYTVRNKGVNSTTSAMWLAGTNGVPDTWANLMAASDAGYVAIQLGVNDEFDMDTTTFTSNLTQMITIARQNGKFPLLVTPYIADFSGLAAYAQAMRDAGAQNNVPVFDLFAWSYNIVYSGTGNVRDYCPDGVHPSDQLYIDAGIKVANSWYSLIPSAGDNSGSTVYDTFFGMHVSDPQNQPWPSVNFKTVRLWDVAPNIAWKDIHTADGVFDWTNLDAVMNTVSQFGVDVIYTIGLPPSWATDNADNVSNPSAAATTAFVNAIIGRYHDRIKYWEVWNDPSSTSYWTGQFYQLVAVAQTVASVAHSNSCVVLSPSPHTNPDTWFTSYFNANGGQYTDVVAFQSYKSTSPEAVVTTVSNIKAVMAAHSLTAQLWDVKASWGIDTDPFGTSDTLKKQYLSRSLLLERNVGVTRVMWYQYDGTWGQLQNPSTDTLTVAGTGYQSMNAWVAGNNMQPYVQSGTVYKIAVTGANNYNGMAVWNTAGSSSFTVPGGMVRARDLAGNIVTVTAGNAFTIGTEPVFFDNGAQVPTTTNPFPTVPVGHPYTYTLTFQDEFDGSTIDSSKWNTHIFWNAQTEEAVLNWQVSGGELKIWPVSPFNPRTIDTDGKYYQTYGFFECEAKLPIGLGCWPAFWLYNHDDAVLRPEIDIMEAYSGGGVNSGWSDANLHPINFGATLHKQDGDVTGAYKLADYLPTVDLSAGYHKYGCLWEPDGVTFFFDGQQLGPKMMTTFFTYRMYILLDLYFGSASGTPTTAGTPQGISNAYAVRYVRAWKKN